MALSTLPLTEIHLMVLASRPNTGGVDLRNPQSRRTLLEGEAFALADRGEIFGAAGIVPMWAGVGHGWAIIAVPTGCRRLIWLTRQVRRYLDECPLRRVQTTVDNGFAHGLAWATHLLAFQPEGILHKYDAKGNDHILMARVRAPAGTNANARSA